MDELDIDKLKDIFRRNNVRRIALFGSFAREDAGPESDIDMLVTFTGRVGLLALVKLERELSEELDREIDLLTENSISPYLKDQILREQKVIYEEAG
jgi:predicted nucleotidyltransferase